MTGFAERTEITAARGRVNNTEWAPYRAAHEEQHRGRSRFTGIGVFAAVLLFSGINVAVGRGHANLAAAGYGISRESLLVAAWLIQGATALLCFVLADRWLRS
jgi:hypothetical protein